MGTVEKHAHSCVYVIRSIEALINNLVPVLDANPLRTTKYFDYLDFKFLLSSVSRAGTTVVKDSVKESIMKIIQSMNTGRVSYNIESIIKSDINKYWLLGFIEGEGTFGLKNLVPYFQIGQHERSSHVMTDIEEYLSGLPNTFLFTKNSPILKAYRTSPLSISKNQRVIVLSYQNIDSLHDTLAYFLLDLSFQTRKNTDFLYWCLVLYMHKFGHFYLTKGRELTIAISKYINASRYSNSGKEVTKPILDLQIFETLLPVILTPDMSHLTLAQSFARVKENRIVWVYDKGVVVKGSPFKSYSEVCEVIGINRNSKIVSRYLDTDKLYKERYSFYSQRFSGK